MDEPINKKIYITKMTTPFSKQLKTAVQQKLYSKVQQAAILFDQPVPRKTTSMKVLENKLQKVFKDNNINSIDELDRLISVRQSQLKNQLDLPDSDQSDLISLNRKVIIRTKPTEVNMKICSKCKQFGTHSRCLRSNCGLQTACKKCRSEERKERMRQYRQTHKEELNRYKREKYRNNINQAIKHTLQVKINQILKQKTSAICHDIVGCSLEEFRAHLDSTHNDQTRQMARPNVDHIIPAKLFDLTNIVHQKVCFHFTNLQWLTPRQNNEKFTALPENFDFDIWFKQRKCDLGLLKINHHHLINDE